ncbi:hypothetical protein GGS21DRAFT_501899 [Xylaria nigripes]|nr:hypothetical protein GGS21DRAFT_501899 [Xylaria nigripes]
MPFAEPLHNLEIHGYSSSLNISMEEETGSYTGDVGYSDDVLQLEQELQASIETDDDYDVTQNGAHGAREEEDKEHSVGSDDDSFQSDDRELPYVERSGSAATAASNMSGKTRKSMKSDQTGSQRDAMDEDVFTDESPRSSTGSYDVSSESGKVVDVDNLTTITHSSRVSTASQYDKEDYVPTNRETPRPPLRTSSDARGIQISSPPSSTIGSTRSSKKQFPTVSRIGTPSASAQYSPKRMSTPPRFKSRHEAPLVLLHVTLLPLRWMWGDLVNSLDPAEMSKEAKTLRNSWRMLQDRVGDTVIERGVLLGHPQNDYEVLEERLLEALDLPVRRRARILECGHYYGPSNESTIVDDEDNEDDDDDDDDDGEDRRWSGPKRQWCATCNNEIRLPPNEAKVFRVKVYASNGLMRAGAWEACWKEMERVDVELEPIVEPALQDEIVRLAALQQEREMAEQEEDEIAREAATQSSSRSETNEAADRRRRDEERLREIYGYIPSRRQSSSRSYGPRPTEPEDAQVASSRRLLIQSVRALAQDRRNIIIVALSVFLLIALQTAQAEPPYEPIIHVMKTIPQIRPMPIAGGPTGQEQESTRRMESHYAQSSYLTAEPFREEASTYSDVAAYEEASQPFQVTERAETFGDNRKVYCNSPASSSSSKVISEWEWVVKEEAQEMTEKKVVKVVHTVTETQTHTYTEFQTVILKATGVPLPRSSSSIGWAIENDLACSDPALDCFVPEFKRVCAATPILEPEPECAVDPLPDCIVEPSEEQEEVAVE